MRNQACDWLPLAAYRGAIWWSRPQPRLGQDFIWQLWRAQCRHLYISCIVVISHESVLWDSKVWKPLCIAKQASSNGICLLAEMGLLIYNSLVEGFFSSLSVRLSFLLRCFVLGIDSISNLVLAWPGFWYKWLLWCDAGSMHYGFVFFFFFELRPNLSVFLIGNMQPLVRAVGKAAYRPAQTTALMMGNLVAHWQHMHGSKAHSYGD